MDHTSTILGDYADTPDAHECLVLRVSSTMLSRQHQWLNNSLTADFLAEYWGTLARSACGSTHALVAHAKDVISYTANELLDNAIKYGCPSDENATRVTVRCAWLPDDVRVYVTNHSVSRNWMAFRNYIEILLTEEPAALYFRQMEDNAASPGHAVSRLGLLSILHDYHGRLGWKCVPPSQHCRHYTITTMAQIPLCD